MTDVDRRYYQPPDPVVVLHCDKYGCEIYKGDTYYKLNGRCYCEDCITEALSDDFDNLSTIDKLDLLGGTIENAEEREALR